MPGHETPQLAPAGATPVRCHPRFPLRNRRFPDRCRSPDCASTAFRCRCLLLRQKLFVLPYRGLRNNYILCPTGTPTHCGAPRRNGRDLIIANPVEANTPTVAGQAVAEASAPVNAGTVLLTDNDDRCTSPASTHRQIRTCPPRAKGSLDRRSKWFSLVPFFLQKKKGTRAGARNSPSRARRQCPPNTPAALAATYPLRCSAPQWARFDNRHSTSAPTPTLTVVSGSGARGTSNPPNRQRYPPYQFREASTAKFALACPAPRDP